jgi:hypothetical protein
LGREKRQQESFNPQPSTYCRTREEEEEEEEGQVWREVTTLWFSFGCSLLPSPFFFFFLCFFAIFRLNLNKYFSFELFGVVE